MPAPAPAAPAAAAAATKGSTGTGTGTKPFPLNETKLEAYKKKVCPLVPEAAGGGGDSKGRGWKDQMMPDEIFELALLNMAYGLTTDAIAHIPSNLGNKKKVIDLIAYVTKTTCDTSAISSNFINGIKNLFLYYLIKIQNSDSSSGNSTDASGDDTDKSGSGNTDSTEWTDIIDSLITCASEVAPITFSDNCGKVSNVKLSYNLSKEKSGLLSINYNML